MVQAYQRIPFKFNRMVRSHVQNYIQRASWTEFYGLLNSQEDMLAKGNYCCYDFDARKNYFQLTSNPIDKHQNYF